MDVCEAIRSRRSVRSYKDTPIKDEVLEKLLEAMRMAPSGNNSQPCRYVVLKDKKAQRDLVTKACHQAFIAEAPVIIAICCPPGNDMNAAIVVDHLTLAAKAEGLGTCWIRWFEKDEASRLLALPDGMEVAVIVPVGVPDTLPDPTPRKSLTELVHYDRW